MISPRVRKWLWVAALAAGLSLRLFFVLKFPTSSGDVTIYRGLAFNWRDHGTYGLVADGKLAPVDIRVPGYPAMILAVASLFGRGDLPLMLAQAAMDLGTCVLIAWIAGLLVPGYPDPTRTERIRGRVELAALWFACLCPFLADYCAVPLTEVPAAFFTAAALFVFAKGFVEDSPARPRWWLLGGFFSGCATMIRPESPLIVITFALVAAWRWLGARGGEKSSRKRDWARVIRAGALCACGFILPVLPWTIRNAVSLHEFQPVAPRYANSPGDFVPIGFYAWTKTWLVRYRYVYLTTWKVTDEPLSIGDLPASAFDNDAERDRVAKLFDEYNDNCCDPPPGWDESFAALARERTARHPLRTYLKIPFERVFVLWLTPRIELLPYSGDLWPWRKRLHDEPEDFDTTVVLFVVGLIYVSLGVAGFARAGIFIWNRARPLPRPQTYAIALLAAYCIVRTAFLTQIETPEPRYVLEAFPALLAAIGFLFVPKVPAESPPET